MGADSCFAVPGTGITGIAAKGKGQKELSEQLIPLMAARVLAHAYHPYHGLSPLHVTVQCSPETTWAPCAGPYARLGSASLPHASLHIDPLTCGYLLLPLPVPSAWQAGKEDKGEWGARGHAMMGSLSCNWFHCFHLFKHFFFKWFLKGSVVTDVFLWHCQLACLAVGECCTSLIHIYKIKLFISSTKFIAITASDHTICI